MTISETPISDDTLRSIRGCANDAAEMLGIDLAQKANAEIVEAVDSFVHRWQKGERPKVNEDDDLSLTLGSLWAQQLVKEFGWQWATLTFHDRGDSKAIGVFSPDRSLAVYPFHFIHGCMEKDATVTIMLAYNMLKDGNSIPPLPAHGFENIMASIRHIVPRD